jgi:PAS domain S-box-containing protein
VSVRRRPFRGTTGLAFVAVLVLACLLAASLLSLKLFRESQAWTRHTYDVRIAIAKNRATILDAETAQRAFLLTGEETYLKLYQGSWGRALTAVGDLARLTADNPPQAARIHVLNGLLRDRLGEQQSTVDAKKVGDSALAIDLVRRNGARGTSGTIQRLFDALDDEELRLLAQRSESTARHFTVVVCVVGSSSLFLLALGGLLLGINRDIGRKEDLEESLKAALEGETDARQAALAATELQLRRARQARLAADVTIAMTEAGSLTTVLGRSCDAAVQHLDAAFVRIWTVSVDGRTLELQASAGLSAELDGPQSRIPIGSFEIGTVAAERKPHLTNDVFADPRMEDPGWARREGLVSFAAQPLLVDDRLVGVIAMFARHALAIDTLDVLSAVSSIISVGLERKRIERAIRQSEAYYRFLANAVPNQVWTATPDGALEYVNQRVTEYFARTFDEMIGAGWQAVVHPDDLPACVSSWGHSLTTGEPYEFEFRLRRAADGHYLAHIARAEPFRAANGQIMKWFGTNTDISDRKRAENDRERLIRALERSNTELDQFAYVASHDLKAPLRGIANLSLWIEEDLGDRLTDESRQHIALLHGRVHRMEALIDGILSYSRAGRVSELTEPVDVEKLIGDAITLLAPPSHVRIHVQSAMPELLAERTPLQQMFLNLIGNALKHARNARPEIRIGALDAGSFVDFFVCDNGPGIAPEFQERIWGIFQTLEARDKVEGTGIGLSIVKKLSESRGGRVWVESRAGEGATFHFLWPKSQKAET